MFKKIYILLRLMRHFNFFFSIKFSISKPKPEEFLIYDYFTGKFFLRFFYASQNNFIYTRKEKINLYVFFISITNLLKSRTDKNFYFEYIKNYIQITNPKIILTINDQDTNFWLLKKFFPKVVFIVIQNSLTFSGENSVVSRLKESKNFFRKLEIDYLFVYGEGRIREFTKYLKVNKKVIPIGSFKNNFYINSKIKSSNKIVYISQFKNSPLNSINQSLYNLDKLILDLLLEFSKMNNLKIFILNKQKKVSMQQLEENYFRNILGEGNFTFLKESSPYEVLNNYNFYINIDSTLGYEALARGKRVAFFNLRQKMTGDLSFKDNYYGFPYDKRKKGPFWTDSSNTKEFNRVMQFIIFSNEKKWKSIRNKFIKPIIEYDYGNKKLLKIINKYVAV